MNQVAVSVGQNLYTDQVRRLDHAFEVDTLIAVDDLGFSLGMLKSALQPFGARAVHLRELSRFVAARRV